jgi:predicted dithiol-disulfide oxidoreductase (DUF899 family)
MTDHRIVSQKEWLEERMHLLAKEKEFTRARDQLSEARRALPWVRVDERYVFQGPDGEQTLAQLFDGKSQLVVYHFMFDPEWDAGCKSCSFWADNFNGIVAHLAHRDVTMVAISRAPLAKLQAYRQRLGWSFKWFSSFGTRFNADFGVTFKPEELAGNRATYNYGSLERPSGEMPGVSTFYKGADGEVFHAYSSYGRGIDILNTAYNYLDLVPKGRDEQGLPSPMAWVRRHDEYDPR